MGKSVPAVIRRERFFMQNCDGFGVHSGAVHGDMCAADKQSAEKKVNKKRYGESVPAVIRRERFFSQQILLIICKRLGKYQPKKGTVQQRGINDCAI